MFTIFSQSKLYIHPNPLICYTHRNYRMGIAAEKKGNVTHTYDLSLTTRFLDILIKIFNEATGSQQIEFLDHAKSQKKLFKITASLFFFFSNGAAMALPFEYLIKILDLMSFNQNTIRQFYHSSYFIDIAPLPFYNPFAKFSKSTMFYNLDLAGESLPSYFRDESLAAALIAADELHLNERQKLADLATSAIKCYPDILLPLCVRITNNPFSCIIQTLKDYTYLLAALKSSPDYLEGRVFKEAILAHVPKIDFNHARIPEHKANILLEYLSSYATELVTFIEEPSQLSSYFTLCSFSQVAALERIVHAENELRSRSVDLSDGVSLAPVFKYR